MRIKFFLAAPPVSTVLAVLILLSVFLSREASVTEALPAFLPYEQSFVSVELVGDGLTKGVYQFSDGLTPYGVMELTVPSLVDDLTKDPAWLKPLCDGESIRIFKKDRQISILRQSWMKASHRVALAIPLHPDRMSRMDWTVLSGVGDALAERIENDRQENGDFGHLDALMRVKGIGKKRIDRWRDFFEDVQVAVL